MRVLAHQPPSLPTPPAGCTKHAPPPVHLVKKRTASDDLNPSAKKRMREDYVGNISQLMMKNPDVADAMIENYSRYFYQSVTNGQPTSERDVDAVLSTIKDIRWQDGGVRFKGHRISLHALTIEFVSGNTCNGFLVKGSQWGGRDVKLDGTDSREPVGLGLGRSKFVQHAILFFNKYTLHVALASMENGDKVSNNQIRRELLVAINLRQFAKQDSDFSACVVLPLYFGGNQRMGMAHDGDENEKKMKHRVPKVYGIMPLIHNGDAYLLPFLGSTQEKQAFVANCFQTIMHLVKNGIIHGDPKPENCSWQGRLLDNGSVTFPNESVMFSGTKGYFSLLQQCELGILLNRLGGRPSITNQTPKRLKQWQDAFGFSATLFFVLVGQSLNDIHEPILSDLAFDDCIRRCADKIIRADFPYPDHHSNTLKELLLDMAGVNPTPPYSNGMGLIGDALVARIDLISKLLTGTVENDRGRV